MCINRLCSFAYIMNVWKLFKGVYDENHILYSKHFPPYFVVLFLAILSIFSLIKIHDVWRISRKSSISRQGKLYIQLLRFALLDVFGTKLQKSKKKTYRKKKKQKKVHSLYLHSTGSQYIHTYTHSKFRQWILFYSCFFVVVFFLLKYNFLRASTFYALWLCWCVYKEIQNRHKYTHRTQSRQ